MTLPSVGKLLRFEFESATAAYDAALREAEQFAKAVLRVATRVGEQVCAVAKILCSQSLFEKAAAKMKAVLRGPGRERLA